MANCIQFETPLIYENPNLHELKDLNLLFLLKKKYDFLNADILKASEFKLVGKDYFFEIEIKKNCQKIFIYGIYQKDYKLLVTSVLNPTLEINKIDFILFSVDSQKEYSILGKVYYMKKHLNNSLNLVTIKK